jgi:hypothetical protein
VEDVENISRRLMALGLDLPDPQVSLPGVDNPLNALKEDGPPLWDLIKPLGSYDKFLQLQTTFQLIWTETDACFLSGPSLEEAITVFSCLLLEVQSMTPESDWRAMYARLVNDLEKEVDKLNSSLQVC